MDRETRRRFESWRAAAPDPQNTVVDDLLAGECDRAGFIQRATMFGLSVPAISAALLAAGEAPAAFAKTTRGKAGGRLRIGLTPIPKGNLEPWTYQETAALQMGGISGEFLNRNRQNLTLAPGARGQLEAQRRRQRVDVQAAPGRQVRQRQADDGRRRHRDVPPPAHGSDVAGRLGVQRRALGRGRGQGRRLHDHVQARHAHGELPVPHELDDLPGDHPARRTTPARSRRRLRPRAPSISWRTPPASAPGTSATRPGGAARPRSTAST